MSVNQRLPGGCGNCCVGFQTAVAANVKHGVAALGEYASDEQPPMAVGGVFLAANQSYLGATDVCLKPGDGCLEAGILS